MEREAGMHSLGDKQYYLKKKKLQARPGHIFFPVGREIG